MLIKANIRNDYSKQIRKFGWSYNDHGHATFLPIGDDDDYGWQHVSISKEELLKILSTKEKQRELIGIGMTWKDTNIGGTFLIRENGTFEMILIVKLLK
ncbi:hypothetical protein CS562_20890 [Paenibacillus sp. LK1]|nr:hypothetical protein CS562_20890 [Paenibacillus sp. LK1]